AVTHEGGPLLVLGAAGTGKTLVLCCRFTWLVSQGIAPERIAFMAPSGARADAVREALEETLEQGYEQLYALAPAELAGVVLRQAGEDPVGSVLGPDDRLAMLVDRIDELSLAHHDFGGNVNALLGGFVRRIDRLKAELIPADSYASWASRADDPAEVEFAEVYRVHERMLADAVAGDEGDLLVSATRVAAGRFGQGLG